MTTDEKRDVNTQTDPESPTEDTVAVKVPRGKRRKVRRQKANESKRDALKHNRKITAWKLAARKLGYFTPLVFKQLPVKGTPEYNAIMKERTAILTLYWRLACEATQQPNLFDLANPDKVDPERLKSVSFTEGYKDVYRAQCNMLTGLISDQETQQRADTCTAWENALDQLGYRDTLENVPKRGTKAFKSKMENGEWKKKFEEAKELQIRLL